MSHAFWHPFADMSAVAGHDFVIESGHGPYVTGADGRDYLDGTAGLWYCNVGHGRTEIADAVAAQMSKIASYSNFGDLATQSTLDLADRLAAMAPMADARIFFTSGGSDAVDTAVKLVRRYWSLMGQPTKQIIITRTRSYHGMHFGGTSLAGIPANKDGYGELDPHVRNVAWDDPWALAKEIDDVGADRVAAFFCEPIIGAGGVYLPPEGYLAEVRAMCRERDVLFVTDEVISGFGRAGSMFASTLWDLDPDIMLTAKGLTSGYQPMGAVFVSGKVAEPFWNTPGLVWRHGYTYSGHASAAAAAMANLDIIEREGLIARVSDLSLALSGALAPLRGHSWVSDVRSGVGLLGAVTIDPTLLAEDPTILGRLMVASRSRGVILRPLADGSMQISPPFVIDRDELKTISAALDESLTELGSVKTPRAQLDVDLLPEQTRDDAGGFDSLDAMLRAEVPPHHGA